jgi:hypothetical protein
VLDKNRSADIRVYAVWFEVLAGDGRSLWSPELLTDERVTHLCDATAEVGRSFGDADEYDRYVRGPLAWDIFFLYGPDAQWEEVPLPVVASGSTIIARKDWLKESVAQFFEDEHGDAAAN